ncbi:LysR family transcriptional regulator [Mangrovicoccus algicola]|uniref:LysR family transcriptional regulator n=1 Tax=Mangrovicoccus algicola TaxID=2771008 RepID=A0A8J7CW37_9RHOB|nr:LysR substrate-binding domain-containing protein [Mangrovicoccus algicola]MBE3639494.1 LysR family transcriptional regulator [Mangrovicoccus algicola]
MDLKRLQTFLRVAETGSLSAASDRMRIAQPALSRQIRLLEEEIGQVLFLRSREGMALTPAGALLQTRISGLLRQLDQGIDEVRSLRDAPRGRVAVGLVPSAAAVMGADLALSVRAAHPGIRLSLQQGYTSHLTDWLHRGEIDMALLYGGAGRLPAEELLREELVLVAPRGHPVLGGPADFAALAGAAMVLPGAENGLRLIVDQAAERAGITLDVLAEASAFQLLLELVTAGTGLSILPRSALPGSAAAGRLDWTGFVPPLHRDIHLVMAPAARQGRAARAVVPLLRQAALSALG